MFPSIGVGSVSGVAHIAARRPYLVAVVVLVALTSTAVITSDANLEEYGNAVLRQAQSVRTSIKQLADYCYSQEAS